jgi:hypothetical protein
VLINILKIIDASARLGQEGFLTGNGIKKAIKVVS